MTIKRNSTAGKKVIQTIESVILNGEKLGGNRGMDIRYYSTNDFVVSVDGSTVTLYNRTRVTGYGRFEWGAMVVYQTGKIII